VRGRDREGDDPTTAGLSHPGPATDRIVGHVVVGHAVVGYVRFIVLALALFAAGCSADSEPESTTDPGTTPSSATAQRYPDIVDVSVESDGTTYTFDVTVSSPYDTPERYADGWRVLGPDGTSYGEHTLMHDRAAEQPFTRTQSGVEIPEGVAEVTVEGRDSEHGYGGETVTVPLHD
jgi:hypothetical protein